MITLNRRTANGDMTFIKSDVIPTAFSRFGDQWH